MISSTIEVMHQFDFDGEYVVRIGFPESAAGCQAGTMNVWIDGKLPSTLSIETKPSKLVYFNPYSEEQVRLAVPEGRAAVRGWRFVDDDFVPRCPRRTPTAKENKFRIRLPSLARTPRTLEKASRKKILVCDPKSGPACVEKIVATLAHRAYRRPVTEGGSGVPDEVRRMAKAERARSTSTGSQLAIEAMLVSPHFLFRIERDPDPTDPAKVHRISGRRAGFAAELFSLEFDAGRRIVGLGGIRQACAIPAVLDAQLKRMLADDAGIGLSFADISPAMAGDFATWTCAKPDPQTFPVLGAGAAGSDEDRDAHVLRLHAAREPADFGFPGCAVHVSE